MHESGDKGKQIWKTYEQVLPSTCAPPRFEPAKILHEQPSYSVTLSATSEGFLSKKPLRAALWGLFITFFNICVQ